MAGRRAKILSVLAVLAVALPAAGHAARERQRENDARRDLEAMVGHLAPVAANASDGLRKVTLNGAPVSFDRHTEQGTLDEVMNRVAHACESGNQDVAFGDEARVNDGVSRTIKLERMVVAEAEGGVRASLCIFAPESDDPARMGTSREPVHRVRYTLAYRRDDGSVSVTSVVNASETALATLFPAEGDAPGSDLEGVARPAESRRTLTAMVGKDEHAVRIYESTLPVEASIARYDTSMAALGYATTGTLAEARMYRKDGKSYVASFDATTGGSSITLVPFDGTTTSN